MTERELALMIDNTMLQPYRNRQQLQDFCREALEYGFRMVAVNSGVSDVCAEIVKGSEVHVGAAIGFPFGTNTIEAKVFETKDSIEKGADEIDYVINIGKLKDGNFAYIEDEMRRIKEACDSFDQKIILKVILETCYLSKEEIVKVCEIALKVKPDFVKTSTGYGTAGATVENVRLMKSVVKDEVGIKAAGGIRDLDTLLKMVEAGATRIGTSSGVKIISEFRERNK
ncbi:MAG: deoxyribose-phosphate aldolase [Erysipelotrichaceae bacterium]|nr:deoxyribose-phosphate aldolase [Erysipelotrichaceae bacterium]